MSEAQAHYETLVVDPNLFGWLDVPVQTADAAKSFRAPTLSQAAPRLFDSPSKREDVSLFKAFIDVLSAYPDYAAQTVGDCVSQGTGHSGDLTQCLEIVLGDLEEYKELSTEFVYGASREVGGMLGSWGDGSFGTAALKAVQTMGVLPRDVIGPYDGQRARQWGRTGVPQELRPEALKHLFAEATLVTTLAELDAAIDNGYVGLSGGMEAYASQRDANGVCNETWGRWPHLMALGWGRKVISGVVHYMYAQSWGPNTPSGPTPDNMPNYTFWVPEQSVAKRIARGDSGVIGRFAGFPARSLPSSWVNTGWLG